MKKNFEYLLTGEIIYNGITYPAQSLLYKKISFVPKKWFKHWRKRIKEIKKLKLDYYQIRNIHEDFVHDILMYAGSKQMLKKHQETNHLSTELKIAFQQAYSNYRDSKKGLLAFVSGLFVNKLIDKIEIPKLPLNSKEVKQ